MLYEILFRRMPLPVALVDRDLIVLDASDAYAALAGAELSRLRGAPLAVIFPDEAASLAARGAVAGASAYEGGAVATPSGSAVSVRIIGIEGEQQNALALVDAQADGLTNSPRLAEIYASIRAIKHEINNPLTGALGNINLLLRRQDLDEKTRRRLATAEQEIKKVSQIVLRLSELAPAPQVRSTPS